MLNNEKVKIINEMVCSNKLINDLMDYTNKPYILYGYVRYIKAKIEDNNKNSLQFFDSKRLANYISIYVRDNYNLVDLMDITIQIAKIYKTMIDIVDDILLKVFNYQINDREIYKECLAYILNRRGVDMFDELSFRYHLKTEREMYDLFIKIMEDEDTSSFKKVDTLDLKDVVKIINNNKIIDDFVLYRYRNYPNGIVNEFADLIDIEDFKMYSSTPLRRCILDYVEDNFKYDEEFDKHVIIATIIMEFTQIITINRFGKEIPIEEEVYIILKDILYKNFDIFIESEMLEQFIIYGKNTNEAKLFLKLIEVTKNNMLKGGNISKSIRDTFIKIK